MRPSLSLCSSIRHLSSSHSDAERLKGRDTEQIRKGEEETTRNDSERLERSDAPVSPFPNSPWMCIPLSMWFIIYIRSIYYPLSPIITHYHPYNTISHRIHGAGIYVNIGGILMVNLTIYSSTMDPMGSLWVCEWGYSIRFHGTRSVPPRALAWLYRAPMAPRRSTARLERFMPSTDSWSPPRVTRLVQYTFMVAPEIETNWYVKKNPY